MQRNCIAAADKNREFHICRRRNCLAAMIAFSRKKGVPFALRQIDLSCGLVFFQQRCNKDSIPQKEFVLNLASGFVPRPFVHQRTHHWDFLCCAPECSGHQIGLQIHSEPMPKTHLCHEFRRIIDCCHIPRAAFIVSLAARHQFFELTSIGFRMPLHNWRKTRQHRCTAIEIQRRKRPCKPGKIKSPEQNAA